MTRMSPRAQARLSSITGRFSALSPRGALFLGALCLSGVGLWGTGAERAAALGLRHSDHGQDQAEQDWQELEELLIEERAFADDDRRRGRLSKARSLYRELLDEDEGDFQSHLGLAHVLRDEGKFAESQESAQLALESAQLSTVGLQAAARTALAARQFLVTADLEYGRIERAGKRIELAGELWADKTHPTSALLLGKWRWLSGDLEGALAAWRTGASLALAEPVHWDQALSKGLCAWKLGNLPDASRAIVLADRVAREPAEELVQSRGFIAGAQPEVLAALAKLYVEADGEVDHPQAAGRSAGALLEEALRVDENDESTLLAYFELNRLNWRRKRRPPYGLLSQVLRVRPDSVAGRLAAASSDLEDGNLPKAREHLALLEVLAPERREVRTLRAALAWVEHRRDEAQSELEKLTTELDYDSTPEREIGRLLNELYRFSEAAPFLRAASDRDSQDYLAWTQLARSLANTGDEPGARDAFERAKRSSKGRHDVWRYNMELVLGRMRELEELEGEAELTYVWQADAARVLETYWVPFYTEAKAELAQRYGFTPGAVRIEIFRRHEDFSVRSTGFAGFPALGVCFGPVVTSLSPLSEMRASFSWARTAFHEFTHVVHLGLSHNRCPRWITEGLATWEEAQRKPFWARNMRRDLVDAYANQDLIPLRELNRAFRGPRILFGYYQGGLLCEMLIAEHGFAPMVDLLQAFDRGDDLDQAFANVFSKTPDEVDAEFAEFVSGKVKDLHIEAGWQPATLQRLKLRLDRNPPEESLDSPKNREERARWADDWCSLAWGAMQQGRRVDAEQILRRLKQAELEPARAILLRAELASKQGDNQAAAELWRAGIGGEPRNVDEVGFGSPELLANFAHPDYRALMSLAGLAVKADDFELAKNYFAAAEVAFPGFPSDGYSAEVNLSDVLGVLGDLDGRKAAQERWLHYQAGNYSLRFELGQWHLDEQRFGPAEKHFSEANEVDPFHRSLHAAWGRALMGLERFEEALREFEVTEAVPATLDPEHQVPLSDVEVAELRALQASCLAKLDRISEAEQRARGALELDPEQELAQEVLQGGL